MSYPIYWKIVHHIFKSLPIYRHIFSHNVSFSYIYIYINTPNMKSHITYTIHVLPHLLEDLSHNVSIIYIYMNYIPLTWNPTSYIPSMSYPIYWKIFHHTFKSLLIYRQILVTPYQLYIYICMTLEQEKIKTLHVTVIRFHFANCQDRQLFRGPTSCVILFLPKNWSKSIKKTCRKPHKT